jgi:adenylate cyclase
MAGPELPIDTAALASWLHLQTLNGADIGTLIEGFCARLLEGVAIERAVVGIILPHPQVDASDFIWVRRTERAERQVVTQRAMATPSPFRHFAETGQEELRFRLDGEAPQLFPILDELRQRGFTDYIALGAFGRPLPQALRPYYPPKTADGVATSFATARAGGFHDAELAVLRTLLRPFAVAVWAAAMYEMAETLLCAYLGDRSGRRVLTGQVRRGQGEIVHAVLWRSDLRGSTALAESASLEVYLATLNAYFDCVVDAVTAHGGEVLKFIGDGVLAMFPFEVGTEAGAVAAQEAVAAAREALERLAAINVSRRQAGENPIRCGIALHTGDAMYGNVGSARRLDFTVMGPAINEVCRLETLCKALSVPFVMSASVANLLRKEQLQSLGWHTLHGVGRDIAVFSLPALGGNSVGN